MREASDKYLYGKCKRPSCQRYFTISYKQMPHVTFMPNGIHEFLKNRISQKNFSGLTLSLLSLIFLSLIILFTYLIRDIVTTQAIVGWDAHIENYLYLSRSPIFVNIFLAVTLLGNQYVVAGLALFLSAILIANGKKIYASTVCLLVFGTGISAYLSKILIHRARPGGLIPYYNEVSFSFPSLHAANAVALYGFLMVIVFSIVKNTTRGYLFFLGTLLIALIGFSRMYLGVHYMS